MRPRRHEAALVGWVRERLIRSDRSRKRLVEREAGGRLRQGWYGLVCVVLTLIVGVGGVVPEALVGAAAIALVTLLLVRREATAAGYGRLRVLGLACAGLVAWTWLQLLPLPLGVLTHLSHQAAGVWAHAREPLDGTQGWGMISLEPLGTLGDGVSLALALCSLLVASALAGSKVGRSQLAWLVILTGIVLCVLTLGHSLAGARRVFGVYEPVRDTHQPLGPLINTNHLAAVVALALSLSLGKLLDARREVVVAGVGAASVLLATLVWLGSRGGIIGAGASCVWFAFSVRGRRNRIQAGMVGFGGAAVVASLSAIWPAAFSTNASKLDTIHEAAQALNIAPWVGVGPGAFEAVFPSVRESSGHVLYTHPENILIELGVSSGYVVGGAFALAALYALRPRFAQPSAAAAHAALVGVLVHDLGDFSLNVPLMAVLVAVTAAIAFSGGREPRESALMPKKVLPSAFWGLNVVAVLALFAARHDTLARTRESLHALSGDRSASKDFARERLARSLVLHPAEPYIPFAGALRSTWEEPRNVIPWASAVLNRGHVYGPVHVLLARQLRGVNRSQARLEYRLAMTQDPRLIRVVAAEAAQLVNSTDDARELLPPGSDGESTLELIVQSTNDRKLAVSLNALLLELYPLAPGGLDRRAVQLRDLVGDGKCDAACRAEVDSLIARMKQVRPTKCRTLEVTLWFAREPTMQALDGYEQAADKTEDSARCLVQVGLAALRAGDRARALRLAGTAETRGCRAGPECVALALELADLQVELGKPADARLQLRRAAGQTGRSEAVLVRWAEVSSSLALHGEAADLYGELARRDPGEKKWVELRQAEIVLSAEHRPVP